MRNALVQGLPDIINNVAKANDVTVEVKQSAYAPVTMNEPKLTEVMVASLNKAAGGKTHLLPTNQAPSEDFAFYAEKIPSLYVFLGATPAGVRFEQSRPQSQPRIHRGQCHFENRRQRFGAWLWTIRNTANKYKPAGKPRKAQQILAADARYQPC